MTFMSPGAVLARPNIFSAGAVHSISGLLLGELPLADGAGFSHYVVHDLAHCLTKTISCADNTPDASECNNSEC
jgi:hypothetical protein